MLSQASSVLHSFLWPLFTYAVKIILKYVIHPCPLYIYNTSLWCIYGICFWFYRIFLDVSRVYVFGFTIFSLMYLWYMFLVLPYFPKSLMIRSLVPHSFKYRELKYETSTSVSSGISSNLYEVVSLVPKRQFFGVYYTYLPYLLLSETLTWEYTTSLVDEALWGFLIGEIWKHELEELLVLTRG
jgi:hypothetical protein